MRRLGALVLAGVCVVPLAASAEQIAPRALWPHAPGAAGADESAPRDIWPQATGAMDAGDAATAAKKTAEMIELGKTNGIRAFPLYASAAAGYARQAAAQKNAAAATWGNRTAEMLDPTSPSVAFTKADAAA